MDRAESEGKWALERGKEHAPSAPHADAISEPDSRVGMQSRSAFIGSPATLHTLHIDPSPERLVGLREND
jgi:hypothetical protein